MADVVNSALIKYKYPQFRSALNGGLAAMQAHSVDYNCFHTTCPIHPLLLFVLPLFTAKTDGMLHSCTGLLSLHRAC